MRWFRITQQLRLFTPAKMSAARNIGRLGDATMSQAASRAPLPDARKIGSGGDGTRINSGTRGEATDLISGNRLDPLCAKESADSRLSSQKKYFAPRTKPSERWNQGRRMRMNLQCAI